MTGGAAFGLFASARYPPTPATATTATPTNRPARDFFGAPPPAPTFIPALGIGVVGALVTSVGVSAVTGPLPRGGGRRAVDAAFPPLVGAETGCSGHTAVAKSSIVA